MLLIRLWELGGDIRSCVNYDVLLLVLTFPSLGHKTAKPYKVKSTNGEMHVLSQKKSLTEEKGICFGCTYNTLEMF